MNNLAKHTQKICIVVSSTQTIKAFLLDQINALHAQYDLSIVANTLEPFDLKQYGIDVAITPVQIERKISLWKDVAALVSLFFLFKKRKFTVVHSVTPKAGLLAMLAGALAGIPVRVHVFTGQVWATRSGLARVVLKTADRVLAYLATHVLVDSFSQRNFLLSQKVVSPQKSSVLANGSISGVDTKRFRPDRESRERVRKQYGIPADHPVFFYLGRLNRDKGVLDLAHAFAELSPSYPSAHLFVVGPDEENLLPRIRTICTMSSGRLHYAAYTEKPEHYMACADIFCLPSYREGFGSVILEAAAAGIPAIGSHIYGITDAIEDGVTGLLFPVGDVKELTARMKIFLEDASLRSTMGEAARQRAIKDFSQEKLTAAVLEFYRTLMKETTAIHAKTSL